MGALCKVKGNNLSCTQGGHSYSVSAHILIKQRVLQPVFLPLTRGHQCPALSSTGVLNSQVKFATLGFFNRFMSREGEKGGVALQDCGHANFYQGLKLNTMHNCK